MTALGADRLRRARAIDRIVALGITAGGSLILLAVALLMVFLVAECLPLLRSGRATAQPARPGSPIPLTATEDEYRERVIVLAADAAFHLVDRAGGGSTLPLAEARPPLREARVSGDGRLFAAVDAAGDLHVVSLRVRVRWDGERRVLEPRLRHALSHAVGADATVLAVAGDGEAVSVLLRDAGGALLVHVGDGRKRVSRLAGAEAPLAAALAGDGGRAWVATARRLHYFEVAGERDAELMVAVAESPLDEPPTAAALLLGDVTCLVGDASGSVSAWQAVAGDVAGTRRLDRAATFTGSGPVRGLAASRRDKSFAVVRTSGSEIAHLTSRRALLRLDEAPDDLATFGFSPRRDGLYGVTGAGAVHRWSLSLPHPEVTAHTLFLPVRYEGFTEPALVWQSTGGSNEFEPKLSLIPLIVGTFKGALYALLFSGPCALAAALYVSQFAPQRVRAVTKPVVELMAALPSVVVGFLAALFLAPLLERHLVGVLALLVAVPLGVAGCGAIWSLTPTRIRLRMGRGSELAVIAVILVAAWGLAFSLEQPLGAALFGGDFRHWLLSATGLGFDQRNAVVVGFALGFAVIPIIFTLAEDAFANVPPSLVSASLALGATPWQAARTVVLPAASPGVFAALMTGLGRAVGETMIVLMATGNTPLLSLSPFDGMRTMSAAIAVELPEAPYGGSLYRVLILTALLLFVMTFTLNTLAVTVSNRLRRRFGKLAA